MLAQVDTIIRYASICGMRTTLDIDDDVLQAAKEMAAREHCSVGSIFSRLARLGLLAQPTSKNGVPIFPPRTGEVVTTEHMQKLMDQEGV